MIYFSSPSALDGNLGAAYNQYMRLLPFDEDWMCFTDLDVCFLSPDPHKQIQEIIDLYPDTGMFTCLTNRVGTLSQCLNGVISEDPNIINHATIAYDLSINKRHDTSWMYNVISGHLMIVKKKTWVEVGGAMDGLLGVDNDISRKILSNGHNIVLMEGLYVFHKYRIEKDRYDKTHLQVCVKK